MMKHVQTSEVESTHKIGDKKDKKHGSAPLRPHSCLINSVYSYFDIPVNEFFVRLKIKDRFGFDLPLSTCQWYKY